MSVQAERLRDRLEGAGVRVLWIPTNPVFRSRLSFLQSIPGIRTVVNEGAYCFALYRGVRKTEIIHHLAASGWSFFLLSVPVLAVGRLRNIRILLNYRGGNAKQFLQAWSWFAVPLMRLADRIAVPSPFLQRVFLEYGLGTVLLPNIGETEIFRYRERATFQPRIIVTRRLERMYGLDCILRAFALVLERFPLASLSIVGAGSEEGSLRRLSAGLKLTNVRFYGEVKPSQLPAIYDEHDIFVNASRIDNFPGALFEAASCGLPIVTTRAGGIVDMLQPGINALMVEVDDFERLGKGVLQLIDNPDQARQMARKARAWAEEFAWPNVVSKLIECYDSCLSSRDNGDGHVRDCGNLEL